MNKIRILLVRPSCFPEVVEVENSLSAMRSLVDGHLEAFYPFESYITCICNEEGKILGLKKNRYFRYLNDVIFGNFFVCGYDDDGNFIGLNNTQIEKYKEVLKNIIISYKGEKRIRQVGCDLL